MGLPVYIPRWSGWRNRKAPTKHRLCQNTAFFRVNMMGGSFARSSGPEERLLGGVRAMRQLWLSNLAPSGIQFCFGTSEQTTTSLRDHQDSRYQPSRNCEVAWEHHEIECSDSQNGDALGGIPAGGHLCPRPGSGTAALQFGEGLRARFENMEAIDGALSPWGSYG